MAWLSFTELETTVVLWSDWLFFCDYGFSVSALWCPLATPTILLGFLLYRTWGIPSRLLQQSTAAAPYLGRGGSSHGRPSWPWTWSSSSQPSCARSCHFLEELSAPPIGCHHWPRAWGTSSWAGPLTSSNNTREDSTHGHHQMVNTVIILIIFFAAKDGEVLYSQQKQDQERTVAQIMNSLLSNSDLNWRKEGKPLDHSGMT